MARSVSLRAVLTVFTVWLFALLPLAAAPSRAADMPPAQLFAALKGGGHVIYFRHGATTWSGVDRIEWPRARQRLLSDEGIAQSEDIGAAVRRLGLPIGQVIASPFARCCDMAEIAFGRVEERRELLGLLSDAEGRPARVAYLRARLSAPSPDGNRIVVAHRSNIQAVAGIALGEGDAVVVDPLGDGQFRVLGILTPDDWRAAQA